MVETMQITAQAFNLGPVNRIPVGEGRAFQIGNSLVAVFRTRRGEVFATQAFCSYKPAPLADGVVGGGRVMCPLHGCEFDLATGRPIRNGCKSLKTYPVLVDETGDILVRTDGGGGVAYA